MVNNKLETHIGNTIRDSRNHAKSSSKGICLIHHGESGHDSDRELYSSPGEGMRDSRNYENFPCCLFARAL